MSNFQWGNFYPKLIIELLIFIAVIVVLGGGVIFFGSQISKYSEEIVSLRKTLNERSFTLTSFARLEMDNKKAANYSNIIFNIIPKQDQLINLSQDFQSLAAQNNLEYAFLVAKENEKNEGAVFDSISFQLNVGGDFDKIIKFMQATESFRYLSSFDGFNFSRSDSKIKLTTKGKVFFKI